MSYRRSFLLLEVLVGLALLAGLGAWVVQLQARSVREYRYACQRNQAVDSLERLLWSWRESNATVILPATGRFDEQLTWRREVRPLRVAWGVLATEVTVAVTTTDDVGQAHDVYRAAWLVPRSVRVGASR